MAEKVLVIGYGRAGKRHANHAATLGLDVFLYDPANQQQPYVDGYYNCLFRDDEEMWGNLGEFDRAIICTPPKLHLEQIKVCLETGVKVLCEKPLCDIGQLDETESIPVDAVMVAYNYRYHPKLRALRGKLDYLTMMCMQYREKLPEWGLLLDHCSHDLDILRMLVKDKVEILSAYHSDYFAGWGPIQGEVAGAWVISSTVGAINEVVTCQGTDRVATIEYHSDGIKTIDIDPDPKMFADMWKAFLSDDYEGSLAESVETQRLLETCYEMDKDRSKKGEIV